VIKCHKTDNCKNIPTTQTGKVDKRGIAAEYGRRVKSNITPRWFKDPLNEKRKKGKR
jgi:hypothetical protein